MTILSLINPVNSLAVLINRISFADPMKYIKKVWNSVDENTVKRVLRKIVLTACCKVEDTNVECVNEDERFQNEDD